MKGEKHDNLASNNIIHLNPVCIFFLALWFLVKDSKTVTPDGIGTVTVGSGDFEKFPLPKYVTAHLKKEYKSYFIEVEPGIKIHVLETGSGFPVYLQHGNPTSGLLYRKIADILSEKGFRCIMPTIPGLGFSAKIPAKSHTLENHIHWMSSALDKLDLKEMVFVGQDWGGPVGLGAVMKYTGRVKGLLIMNTGISAPRKNLKLSKIHARLGKPLIGELVVEILNLFFKKLSGVQGDPATMPDEIIQLYSRPVRDSGNYKAPLALLRMVPDGLDHPSSGPLRQIEDFIQGFSGPVEIVWGMKDPILGKRLDAVKSRFPQARVTETKAGHFLQEEVPETIAEAVMRLRKE